MKFCLLMLLSLSFSFLGSCTLSPNVFHHVRTQAIAQNVEGDKSAAEQDLERIGYLNEALAKEIEEIRDAGAATARAHMRGQQLGRKYGIQSSASLN